MILLTGATGIVGTALLPQLLAEGHQVRALVRDPRRLGPQRVNVQIALVDLADPHGLRHALRGCDTVIHLAAAIRDQPPRRVEEVNGLGTLRLLQAAERLGAQRFLFFSAINATRFQRTRFFRSKALAERAVLEAEGVEGSVFAPSIVFDRDDPWVTLLRRLALLPMLPVSGEGSALFQPIWAADVARAVIGWLDGRDGARRRHELVGPEVMSYDEMARTVAASAGRPRPLLHLPLPLVRTGLIWLRRLVGENAFATWEEAELMEVAMTTPRGTADVEALGVEPLAMRDVLGESR